MGKRIKVDVDGVGKCLPRRKFGYTYDGGKNQTQTLLGEEEKREKEDLAKAKAGTPPPPPKGTGEGAHGLSKVKETSTQLY